MFQLNVKREAAPFKNAHAAKINHRLFEDLRRSHATHFRKTMLHSSASCSRLVAPCRPAS